MLISKYTSKNIKLRQNRQQKSATYFARLLLHDLESMLRVLPSTLKPVLQQITEPVASHVNPKFWFDKITRKSRHTRELHLGPVKCETSTDLVAKSKNTVYLLQQLFAT